jgi:putative transposase
MAELLLEYPGLSRVHLCRVLGISRSESYRKPAPKPASLTQAIEKIVMTFLGYGYRRVHRELLAQGLEVSCHRVRKTMREEGLSLRSTKPKGITRSNPKDLKYENLLRQYEPTQVDEIWVSDMTLIRTRSGPVHLASLMDLHSRKIVSYALSRNPDGILALKCLRQALERRRPSPGWIHHSDQGSVYTASDYVAAVRAAGGRISMSRPATPTDNAHAESLFATIKKEAVKGNQFENLLDVELSLSNYIDGIYNPRRMHSSLGYLSPDMFEARAGEVGE